ncbi:hypothetical protein ACFX11_021031 [Malus domestica]
MKEIDTLVQRPGLSQRPESNQKTLTIHQTTTSHLMEGIPEELNVLGLADYVDHCVEEDNDVDLEEELVGELEGGGVEVRVKTRLGRVLLLVENNAYPKEVGLVNWGWSGDGLGGCRGEKGGRVG